MSDWLTSLLFCTFFFSIVLHAKEIDRLQVSSESVPPKQNQNKSVSVIIIGAGVSGLTAATTLLKAGGYSVTVLEAGDYIGGRIRSQKVGDNYVEFGAEWVHGEKGNSIYELVSPLGLLKKTEVAEGHNENQNQEEHDEANNVENGNMFATQFGEEMSTTFNEMMRRILNALGDEEDDDSEDSFYNSTKMTLESLNNSVSVSLGQFATTLFELVNQKYPIDERPAIKTAALDWIHRSINVQNSADDWFTMSINEEGEQYEICEGDQTIPWKSPATYSSLLKIILGQSPNASGTPEIEKPEWVKLSSEVIRIDYSEKNDEMVTLTCKNGETYNVDIVLSTVSLGVLKEKHSTLFNPKLPEKKQLAIQNIGFGTVDKIYLEFETEWWFDVDENFIGVNPLWIDKEKVVNANWVSNSSSELLKEIDGIPVWCRSIETINLVDSESHPNVLQVWISGVSARFMETLDMDYVSKDILLVLRKLLGKRFKNIPDPIRSYHTNWYLNPFFRGSYSYRTLDSDKFDVWAKDLATPILNSKGKPIVSFAGEATHGNYYSTVHGAYDTGIREAYAIMKYK